jgi:hypothetical protein
MAMILPPYDGDGYMCIKYINLGASTAPILQVKMRYILR